MAGTVCGAQYRDKQCECRLQVTPGITPATGEASNPKRICSFLDSEQTLIACDPGCCPTDCSDVSVTADDTRSPGRRGGWWWFVVTILFGLAIASTFVYRSTVRNARGRLAFLAYIAALVITAVIIVLVNVLRS